MSEIAQTDNFNDTTIIKVVGVGGAGGNAVNRMIAEGLQNVEFVAINTDAKDLLRSDADDKISLSDASSRGLGAGADPEKGAKAAQDHQSEIEEAVKGADMVFVTCGEGGGTGTGASPLVARAARQQGALTIAVVTRPFSFEGPQRAASAALGIDNLREEVDALIVIPNDRLLELDDSSIGIVDAFRTADTALLAGVQGITDLLTINPYIHVDFSDITSILQNSGTALFGIGAARGEDRAAQAAEIAISSPLLEESIDGASGVLINIAASNDLKLAEVNQAVGFVREAAHPEAQIIFGLALDDAYGDEMRVTVIAAGFNDKKKLAQANEDAQAAASAPQRTVKPVTKTATASGQPTILTSPIPSTGPVFEEEKKTDEKIVAQQPTPKQRSEYDASSDTSSYPYTALGDLGDLDIPEFLQ